jgi:anthranilate synthase component 1
MTNGVLRHPVTTSSDPEAVFCHLLATAETALWWESLGDRGSQVSVIGFGEEIPLTSGNEWDTLQSRWVKAGALPDSDLAPPLGVVGWLGYDLTVDTLGIDVGGPKPGEPATSRLVLVSRALSWNHHTGDVTVWALGDQWDGDLLTWRDEVLEALDTAPSVSELELPPPTLRDEHVFWRDTPDHYRHTIARAKEAIRDGEVYQLCVTTEVVVHTEVSDVELYRLLRRHNPAPHQALMRIGGISLVASSPETFLHISPDRVVTTKPIKGTRPRGVSSIEDAQIAAELSASDKEQAENLMIVDLMRNDLSRVCDESTIDVPQLLEVETYPSVHQLVSTVTGTLRDDVSPIEAVRACFPGGSMTGAPKHRAVSILTNLESEPRGIYSGCFGIFSVDGSLTLAMTIRTAIVEPGRVSLGVGGGITWSSIIDDEVAEVGHKARGVLRCLGVSDIQYS